VEFARRLLASPVVLNVDLPVTRKIVKDREGIVEFNLNCSLKDFNKLFDGTKDGFLKK
jgi:hypothetical protein